MSLTTGLQTSATQFNDAMKTFYLGPLNDQVERQTVLLDRLEKNSEDVSGNFAYVPLISTRNPGVGSRIDTDSSGPALPTIGSQGYRTATFRMGYHYARAGISGPVMRASKNNAGAFAKALDVEMKGLALRLPEDLNRQLWSFGHGRAGTVNSDQASSTLIDFDANSIFSMKIGDRTHFANIDGGSAITGASTVLAITRDTSAGIHQVEFVIDSGTLTATLDACYFGDAGTGTQTAHSSHGKEIYGIPSVVGAGALAGNEEQAGHATEFLDGSLSFGGIDRTTNPYWQAQELRNSGTNRALTVTLLERAFLTGSTLGGASEKSMEIYTNPGLWATIGLLHIGDRIFNDFKETLDGGWIAIMWNNRPIFYDRDAPRNKIWFLDMTTLFLLTQSGYEFMDDDGSIMSRQSGVDAYEFTLYRDIQLGCRNSSKNVLLDDVTSAFNIEANV